ncbi:hypothetical protein OS189_08150 [Sulfitobacter sp. F26169L]|uniref:hypothetical protein n=1 Tax=Sulfitobacter sp. F26169L TaxID=2996015 RepID=UPI002260CCA4|nr:hypothetical protein [Sulfitobacter sp. F26169L]MCX7566313.1 hypothetical protein [Sulfitobacter sp. F26169L]
MSTFKVNTARATLIALIAAAPMAALAAPQSGSPEQSVAEHPREHAAPEPTVSSSNRGNETQPLYDSFDKARVVDEIRGSIHKGDAKRDH